MAFMELTFLKLAGSPDFVGGKRNKSTGLEAEREVGGEAKKIEAPERVWWTGVMAVLELRYQSPDPSAPRKPPYRPTATTLSTPFHSIPPLLRPETILETHRTIPPFPCRVKPPRQTRGFRQCRRASPVPTSCLGA